MKKLRKNKKILLIIFSMLLIESGTYFSFCIKFLTRFMFSIIMPSSLCLIFVCFSSSSSLPCFADNAIELTDIVNDYIKQGLENMRLTTISETKWIYV